MAARDHAPTTSAATPKSAAPKHSSHEFRIVRDRFNGFEVQRRTRRLFFWGPWKQGRTNTHSSIEAARGYAEQWAREGNSWVVERLGALASSGSTSVAAPVHPPIREAK